MAVSEHDKTMLSKSQQAEIERVTQAAQSGSMSWADAHDAAENIRKSAGYSGGADGSGAYKIGGTSSGKSSGGQYAGTDFHQNAIDAAKANNWEGVYSELAKRADKIAATGDDYGKTNEQILADLISNYGQKPSKIPEHDNSLSPQIDAMLQSILNREPFSYDHTTDPVYLAYEQQYKRMGDRAREDTLGDVAALNGGYASSWATSAASQAQNDFNSQLGEVIPTLYDAAYNRYLTEDSLKKDDLGLLMGVDQTKYDRYRDTVADSQWGQEFDYRADRDKVADEQWKQTFDWNKTVDQWNMDNTEATQKFDQLMSRWQLTGVADAEVAAALGVPVGATTESYYFNSAQLALSKAKMAQGDRETAKAEKEKSVIINNIAGQVKNASETGADSYYSGTSLLLELIGQYNNEFGAGLGINDYYTIGAQAGIPSYILDDAFSDMANDLAGDADPVEKNYLYYASLMGQQDDPEAWLEANKWNIPADILKALRENFIDY